ncbi:ABC transporter permease (plasmid) [Microvirga sp. VF16]|nr:ABC transporter permease [Microvirga sp. VF16]
MFNNLFAVRQTLPRKTAATLSLTFFIALVLLWSLASGTGWITEFFLPSPYTVVTSAWRLYVHEGMLGDLAVSIYRVAIGFLLAAAIAVPLGLLMGSLQLFRSLLEPFLAFLRYMPATAFIPLLVLWLGIDDAQKFAVIFIGTFFTLCLMVMASTLTVPVPLIESAMMLGASKRQLITKVIWPAAKPAIFDNLRIVLGWAWTYIVVAEIVAASSGVGYVILSASRFLDTGTIFVGILSIGIVGLVSDLAFNVAARWLFPYIQRSRA